MPGLIARLVMKSLMKNRPNYEHYVSRDYEAERRAAARRSALQPLSKRIARTKEKYGIWYELPGADRSKVVFFIHGGGFNTGSAAYSYNMVQHLCRKKDYAVFNAEYRLAPENPFPAGLEDCVSAYEYVLSTGVSSENIVMAGDSAGGNLVFALALYLRDHALPLPSGLAGISPVGTVDDSLPSRVERRDLDCIIGPDFTEEMQITYVHEHDAKDPYLSPIYGDFTGLPPIWLCVGTEEIFYDDAFALKRKAEEAGIPVELLVGEGLCHVYPMIPDRQSTEAIKSLRHFIEKRILR